MSEVSGRIRGLEQVGGFGGKAVDPRRGPDLRPRQRLLQEDAGVLCRDHAGGGARGDAAVAAAAGADDQLWRRASAPAYAEAKAVAPRQGGADKTAARSSGNAPIPPVGELAALDFPTIDHTSCRTGCRSITSSARAVPVTQVALAFDAGNAADGPTRAGLRR